jgi:hypothetical protein
MIGWVNWLSVNRQLDCRNDHLQALTFLAIQTAEKARKLKEL